MEEAMDISVQQQINEINQKLDLVLEEIQVQRRKRQEMEDLLQDLSIVGKDLFKATVDELDYAGVEIDAEALKNLFFKLIRNVGTFNELIDMLESGMDLLRDVSPIVQQMGLDGINKMNELEQKGYVAFTRESIRIVDNIVTHFTVADVRLLADNVVSILETVKDLTQPDMLGAMNNAVEIFKNTDPHNIEEYSLWRVFREMQKPGMRRGIGFVITFLKAIAAPPEIKRKENDN